MKVVSVIGTRPQYIKFKPLYDRMLDSNINHIIVDTQQHYSRNVSEVFIQEFGIKIDHFLNISNQNNIYFNADCHRAILEILIKELPDLVICYGDTNSTFNAARAARELKIPLAHVEAGLRCGNLEVQEEVNRVYADLVSDLKFCSSRQAISNLNGAGVFAGDLEYELLTTQKVIAKDEAFGVMTIHREENMDVDKLNHIFSVCKQIKCGNIHFYIHHRTKAFLAKHPEIIIPENVKLFEPCNYSTMINELAACRFVLTDSGGIQKTSPYFGNRTLVFRRETEWVETLEFDYCKLATFESEDFEWLISNHKQPNTRFYLDANRLPSEIILKSIQ